MMIVTLPGNESLRVFFDYKRRGLSKKLNGKTICKLLDGKVQPPDEITYAVGTAVCFKPDNFNKGMGRRIALTKALKSANLDKPARTAVWQAYFERCADLK